MPRINSSPKLKALILRKCLLIFFIVFFSFISITLRKPGQSSNVDDQLEDNGTPGHSFSPSDGNENAKQSKLQKRSIFESTNGDSDSNDKSSANAATATGTGNNQMDFDGNSLDFVGSRAQMAFDPLKGAIDGAPMVETEFNDESFNNMDAFSLGTGLGDTDQGLIDFANDDEVESIAAGPSDDQVTVSKATATTSTSSPTSTWRGKSEKSLESLETGQKVHQSINTLPSVDFDVGDGTGDAVQSEENGAVEVYDEDTRARVTKLSNNLLNGGGVGGDDDQQPQLLARQEELEPEDGEDEKVVQNENVQSAFNGDAVNRAAMRQLKSFSPSKPLDRSQQQQQQHHQQQLGQHPHQQEQHQQNHQQQQQRVSLEDTGEAIILGDSNVFKLDQASPKWRANSKTLDSGFLGESFDGQGENEPRHRSNQMLQISQITATANRYHNNGNANAHSLKETKSRVTPGERMAFVSNDDTLTDPSDALTDDLAGQDVTSINNFIPYSGHRSLEGLKVKRGKFKTHTHDHAGHSIHHSSLYSSLPVPFVFSAIRPVTLQGRTKSNHGVNDDRKKRVRDVDLSEVHRSRPSSASLPSVSSNIHPAGRMMNGQLLYSSHNSKDTLVRMASEDISPLGDHTAYHANERVSRLGAAFASSSSASRGGNSLLTPGNNFNRLKRADSSSSQQSPKSKIERDPSEGQSEPESKSSDNEETSKASPSSPSSSSPASAGKTQKVKSKSKSNSKQSSSSESGNSLREANSTAKPGSDHNSGLNVTTLAPLINLVPAKKNLECEMPAYLEFPPDIFGQKWRARGFVLVHVAVVCYMFYCLAVVCDNYFLPALEECAQRLGLSDDVAGATFMAAGSSAPELFTALLGVFIAKGDVGTGTIVGSAVFNILFVIGLCGVFTSSAKLNWWPVMRDSSYYALTVLVLILCICDGQVGTIESSIMLILYFLYIVVMKFNVELRELVVAKVPIEKWGLDPHAGGPVSEEDSVVETGESIQISKKTAVNSLSSYQSISMDDPYLGSSSWSAPSYDQYADPWNTDSSAPPTASMASSSAKRKNPNYIPPSHDPRKTSLLEAACIQILKHRRLFRPRTKFYAAATLIIIKNRKTTTGSKLDSLVKAGPSKGQAKRVMSAIRQDTIVGGRKPSIAPEPEEWLSAPNPLVVGWFPVIQWSLTYPLQAALYYTIPDCKKRPLLFLVTFFMAVLWTAILSYVMVWMVTLIGFTFGIPDSVMGITFLAAGTSIPDAYSSIHVARAGQADMAVSNSIGSNVFDILVGLALPWFIETAVVYPGTKATVKSMGLAYAVILLFVTLVATIALIHLFKWTLNPKLGYSLLAVYAAFLVVSVALEFNLLGAVNPPTCVT